jgi:hypothetical protein
MLVFRMESFVLMYAERRYTTLDIDIAPLASQPATSRALTDGGKRSIGMHPHRCPNFEVMTTSPTDVQTQRRTDTQAVVREEVQPAPCVDVPLPPAAGGLGPVGPDPDHLSDPAPDPSLRGSQVISLQRMRIRLGMKIGIWRGGNPRDAKRRMRMKDCYKHAVQEHAVLGLF